MPGKNGGQYLKNVRDCKSKTTTRTHGGPQENNIIHPRRTWDGLYLIFSTVKYKLEVGV